MDALLQNKPLLAMVALAVVGTIAFFVLGKKKSSPGASSSSSTKSNQKAAAAKVVKAKVVWLDASEGAFDQAFDYNARKEIKNSKLRYHMQTIVEAWSKRRCGGVIIKHPSGRETQVIKFKGGQKVNGKPYLEVEFVAFTSDRRRTMLFLDGIKMEEIECEDEAIFELARKNILAQTEGGRKTCPLSNLAFRQTFIAPVAEN